MTTNRMFTVLRLLALGVLVAGFNAKPASAQAFQGEFTLTSATRWGLATLPAGEYSFTLGTGQNGGMVTTVFRGTRCVALIPTRASGTTSDRSEMVLEGGTVREVRLPQIGLSFDYPAPNPRHPAAPEEQLARIIPVAAAGAGR